MDLFESKKEYHAHRQLLACKRAIERVAKRGIPISASGDASYKTASKVHISLTGSEKTKQPFKTSFGINMDGSMVSFVLTSDETADC